MPILHLDDVDLYYEIHGDGLPFLFCSATATHGDVWKLCQVPDFSRDHQVITYDQRGTGRSVVRSTDFSTQRLTADAAALLDAVATRPAIVCGHSNGGRVAQLLALDYPGKVKKMILASSGGTHGSKGIPLEMCMELVEMGYAAYVRDHAIANGFTRDFIENHPDRVARFLDVRLGNPPPLEIFLRHVIGRQNYDSGNRLQEIAVPTLVLVGDDEDHGPPGHKTHRAFAESLAREIPDAKLVVLEGQAHYYYFSDAETTNRVIRQFIAAT
jgi:pimeloyl-ACP methyl ester carboxylesterase